MATAEFHQKDILDLFDSNLHDADRYFYPEASGETVAIDALKRFQKLRANGNSITLVDGAFDVPHNNHEWYLRHCRLLGAFAALKATSGHALDTRDFKQLVRQDDALLTQHSLAVTLDADNKIASKKSGLSEKGGVRRPIYPWQARADRLAGYHFSQANRLHQTVNLVTVEGDDRHHGTPLESSLTLASYLKSQRLLDTFIVYGEHSATVDEADNLNLEPIVISDDSPYELNPQTGEPWSSSSIIRHAQGEPVAIPITRPVNLMRK